MVNNLSEEEILDYLMTSDFNEGLTPEEFKLLLFKFRNFYRIFSGRNELLKSDIEKISRNFDEFKVHKENEVNNVLSQKARLENALNFAKQSRKLSWKERWTGKTIVNEAEIDEFKNIM
jgi:hypothetical protein